MKHTPAPWTYREDWLTVDADGIAIADIRCSDVADEAIEPNARLIAAAPEMLDALHIALIQIRADFNTRVQQPAERQANKVIMEVIEDAIAKAEGNT